MMFLLFKNDKFKMRWLSNDSFRLKQVSELPHAMQQLAEVHEPLLVWAGSKIQIMRWVDTEKLQHSLASKSTAPVRAATARRCMLTRAVLGRHEWLYEKKHLME